MTPLHMAASHSHPHIVKMLIEKKANLRCKDDEEITPLHAACTEGDINIVKMLFNAGARQDGWVTIQSVSFSFFATSEKKLFGITVLHVFYFILLPFLTCRIQIICLKSGNCERLSCLILSQTTNFSLFQTERVCRRQFHL